MSIISAKSFLILIFGGKRKKKTPCQIFVFALIYHESYKNPIEKSGHKEDGVRLTVLVIVGITSTHRR
jgi:hypothetical protein